MNKTYNPIVEVRDLPRIRVSVRDLRPKAHTVLVLVASTGESMTILPGQSVPQPRTGSYREAYFVDVANHLLQMECQLPSSDGAFAFNASVSYRCQVNDPAGVVANRCTDASAAIEPFLKRILRGIARRHGPDRAGSAEQDANDQLFGMHAAGPGFRVSDCSVELSLDGDEASYVRQKRNADHRGELEKKNLDRVKPLIESGEDGLVALYLANHPDDAVAVLDLMRSYDHASSAQRIEALRVIFSKPGNDDDFDMERVRHSIASTIAEELNTVRASASRPALSRGRLRGTLFGEAADADSAPADGGSSSLAADEPPRDPDSAP